MQAADVAKDTQFNFHHISLLVFSPHWFLPHDFTDKRNILFPGRDTRIKREANQQYLLLRGKRLKYFAPNYPRISNKNKPKIYGYLKKVPTQKQYFVSYPYGVGGDTLLDRLSGANNFDFDNWITTALLSYFFNRFILTPFNVPSLTSLLGQAFTFVTGRSFGNTLDFSDLKSGKSRLKRSEDFLFDSESVNGTFRFENLPKSQSLYPHLNTLLSLASVVGKILINIFCLNKVGFSIFLGQMILSDHLHSHWHWLSQYRI